MYFQLNSQEIKYQRNEKQSMTLKFNSVFPEIKDLKRDFSSTGKMFTRTIILLGEKYHQREVGVGCIKAVQVPLAPMNMSQLHIMKITVKNNL